MTQLRRLKSIYTAIAAPGTGKTEAFLSHVPILISAGKPVVLALPTLILSDDIARRASKAGIAYRTIDQRCGAVVTTLEKALKEKADSFIICTQESIRKVRHDLLHDWVLVVDELPKVVDYPDYAVKPLELKRVLDFTDELDGQLWIKHDLEGAVREQVSINRADAQGTDCSTLGRSAAHIFRLLLSKVDVFIDKPQPNNDVRHIRAVEEFTDWWGIFSSAMESHILAASIKNSEFEVFATVHGFIFKQSEFTPEGNLTTSAVTIYPIVQSGRKFSKKMMLAPHGEDRVIDVVLKQVTEHASSTPLLFANTWAGFQFTCGVEYVPKDCRGLNSYSHATEAILLFGGNPSPSDNLGLEYLGAKYGQDFKEAFITTRLLEPSLQAVTRTAVRCHDNTKEAHFYVQDYRVVDYLQSTYFPHATVDWSLAGAIPIKRDGRKLDEQTEEEAKRLISLNTPTIQIHRQTGVSTKKIRKMKEIHKAA
ncbi:DEAD/DEAH box helicase family protein [Pseudomonas reinekei]